MTAIAIWCNHEVQGNPSLWITADSRISTSQSPLIEDGVKIFPLSVVCRSPGADGFFSEAYHAHTFGCCFAGSTLMGQNTYLALTPLLGNLISHKGYVPSLQDIAKHALAYLRLTFDDYKIIAAERSLFEAAIFGYCHRTHHLSIFHFETRTENGTSQVMVTDYLHMKDKDFIYLGSNKAKMHSTIMEAFSGSSIPGRPLSRIPRYVIQDRIDDESCGTIGGDIQLGIADKFGFRQFMVCKPRIKGEPEAYLNYLGRELTPEISRVGEAIVSTPSML